MYPMTRVDFGSCCDVSALRNKLLGVYIGWYNPVPGQKVASYLDLNQDYDAYIKRCRKRYKGNVIRDAAKSEKEGFVTSIFRWEMHIPDVVEINHSKEIRCGGPMRESYRRSVEEMGGAPTEPLPVKDPACPVHWTISWGVFHEAEGYKQGEVVVGRQLLAYINLKRIGDFALYSQILGHGDYLKFGIMYHLHFSIVEWLMNREHPCTEGLDHLIYAGWEDGNKGLKLWKKKTLFEPRRLITS